MHRLVRRQRVGQLDRYSAGHDVFVVASPIGRLHPRDIADVLDNIARHPAGKRAAYVPSAASQWWWTDDRLGARGVTAELQIEGEGFDSAVAAMSTWRPLGPIQALQHGEVLCLHFDHGIGDAVFMAELLSAISHAAPNGGFVAPAPSATTRMPLFWALVSLIKQPRRLLEGIRSTLTDRSLEEEDVALPEAGGAPETEPPTVVVVRSAPNFLSELDAHRRCEGIKASLSSIVITSMCRCFSESGIDFSDRVEVVTDMRRFLPPGKTTLANFNVVVPVDLGSNGSAEAFSEALAAAVSSAAPFIHTVGWVVMLRVRAIIDGWKNLRHAGRRAVANPAPVSPIGPPTVLSFSDLTKLPLNEKVAFSDPENIEFAVILPIGSPSHVTIALSAFGVGQIHATATFYAANVDPAAVRTAMQGALASVDFTRRSSMS
jgi:hypothetical protein